MRRKRSISITAVVFISVLAVLMMQCTGGAQEKAAGEHNASAHQHGGAEHADHDHDQPPTVKITKAQAEQFGIKTAEVTEGTLNRRVDVPGEIRLNNEKVAHIVSQLSGIVRTARVQVGDMVRAGQILAVLESRELAETKAAYLAAAKREQLARELFEREERLWEKKVSSEQEYMTSRQALAERSIEKNAAGQQLVALGVSLKSIDLAASTDDSPLSRFEIRSPIAGRVLEKHLTMGESLSDGANIFVVADLSTVWLDLQVGSEILPELKEGLAVELRVEGSPAIEANIAYVSPVLDTETRTATVRAVVGNQDGLLRPGLFVQAGIRLPSKDKSLLVHKDAVQMIKDHPCVFVWRSGTFELREIVPGATDKSHTEILKGLGAGELVCAENAFHLKAEYIKATGGDLGGCHGHPH